MAATRTLMFAALAALSLAACKGKTAASTDDMSMGNANAPVKMIEYGSVACPHCAQWNNQVFPDFKKKYIDSGQVYYTLREANTGEPSQLAAAGFLIARCAGKDKYFAVVDAIFRDQPNIQQNMRSGLLTVAQSAGLSEDQFNKCLADEKAVDAFNTRAQRLVKDGLDGTPSFMMNGKVVGTSEMSMADLDAAVAKAKAGK